MLPIGSAEVVLYFIDPTVVSVTVIESRDV